MNFKVCFGPEDKIFDGLMSNITYHDFLHIFEYLGFYVGDGKTILN
jgi:hypothetical protein